MPESAPEAEVLPAALDVPAEDDVNLLDDDPADDERATLLPDGPALELDAGSAAGTLDTHAWDAGSQVRSGNAQSSLELHG